MTARGCGDSSQARNDGLFWILRVSVFCGDHLRRDEGIPPYGALILLPIVSTGRHIGRPLPVKVRFCVGATLRGRPFVLREAKTTPGYTGGKKELIARKKVDKEKPPD